MKNTLCFLTLLFGMQAFAQNSSETEAVKATVNRLFNAMKTSDSLSLKSCFEPGAQMQTVKVAADGAASVSGEVPDRFITQVGKSNPGALDERIVFEKILVDGPMAVVWTPYKFYYNGNFSHCGVNVFQLIKKADGWKIVSVMDTRRKEGCDPE